MNARLVVLAGILALLLQVKLEGRKQRWKGSLTIEAIKSYSSYNGLSQR